MLLLCNVSNGSIYEQPKILFNIQHEQQNTYVAIMAGGIGSRFWYASRTARPNNFSTSWVSASL